MQCSLRWKPPSAGSRSVMRLPEIGTPAPLFRLPTAQGREIALEDFRGKSVVLWFSKGLF
jgi:hypothetical protein